MCDILYLFSIVLKLERKKYVYRMLMYLILHTCVCNSFLCVCVSLFDFSFVKLKKREIALHAVWTKLVLHTYHQ